jgi:hypothetical protein
LTAARAAGKTAPAAGLTQLVECQLPKLDVAGSNPVSRSTHAGSSIRRALFLVPLALLAACPEEPLITPEGLPALGSVTALDEGTKGLGKWDPKNGWWPRVAADQHGRLHVGWCNATIGQVWYARRDADGTWSKEPLDTDRGAGRYLTMTLDRRGEPVFAYQVQEQGVYRLLWSKPDGFVTEVINLVDGDGRSAELLIDDDDTVHLFFYGTEGGINYSRRSPSGLWRHETIDPDVQAAHSLSIGVVRSQRGEIDVLYGDARIVKTRLRRARRGLDGNWTLSEVAHVNGPGHHAGFIGPKSAPTERFVYSVTGRPSLRDDGDKQASSRLLLRGISGLRSAVDNADHPVLLTTATKVSRAGIDNGIYLIRWHAQGERLRHYRIDGSSRGQHMDLDVGPDDRVRVVWSDPDDGALYLYEDR